MSIEVVALGNPERVYAISGYEWVNPFIPLAPKNALTSL